MFGSNFQLYKQNSKMFMALDIDSRSGSHDFTLFVIKHDKKKFQTMAEKWCVCVNC